MIITGHHLVECYTHRECYQYSIWIGDQQIGNSDCIEICWEIRQFGGKKINKLLQGEIIVASAPCNCNPSNHSTK